MNVRVFANLREICSGSSVEVKVESEGSRVIEILENLVDKFPPLEQEIFTSERTLQEFVAVFINGQNIIHLNDLNTVVYNDDQFALFPPVAGG